MKLTKNILSLVTTLLFCVSLFQTHTAQAATNFTINFVGWDGSSINTSTISSGSTLGTLPVVSDLILWVDEVGNTVTTSTVPTSDMTIRAVRTSDVTATGTMDSGNLTWFIADGQLIVTGTGSIGAIPVYNSVNSTKKYGFSIGNVEVKNPSIKYEWFPEPSVDQLLDNAYVAPEAPSSDFNSWSLNISRPLSFTGQTISYPHSTTIDYAPWSAYASQIVEMTFAESVSLYGNFTLYFNLASDSVSPYKINESIYSNLENIYLYADTSNVTQFSGTFARIPKLEGIYVKKGDSFDTSACVDASGMFYGDTNLICGTKTYDSGLKLESIINVFSDTSHITDMRYMFFACENLVKPAIGSWDMSSVTDISYMMTGCNDAQLTIGVNASAYDLRNWDLSSVYSATGAFAGSEIDIAAADPLASLWGQTSSHVIEGNVNLDVWSLDSLKSSVFMFAQNTWIDGITWTSSAPLLIDSSAMFAFNNGLVSVDFSNLNTPLLQYADAMFFCSGEENATFTASGWNLSALTESRLMFYNTLFKTINLNDTNPSSLVIASGMFMGNDKLTSFGSQALGNWVLNSLTDASYMFYGNPCITGINVSNWGMRGVETIAYMFGDDSLLPELNISLWAPSNSLKDISCFALNCYSITDLDLSGIDLSGVENAFFAFAFMDSLLELDLSNADLSSLVNAYGLCYCDAALRVVDFGTVAAPVLENAGSMFYSCVALEDFTGPNLIGSSVTSIYDMFAYDSSLVTLDISGWNTSNVAFLQGFLHSATALESITLGSNINMDSVESMASMARGCSSLSNQSLQSLMGVLSTTSLKNAYSAFLGCTKLTAVDLSGKDFSSVKNVSGMYSGIPNLVDITLPDSFLSNVTSTGGEGVFFCDTDVVTDLNIITTGTTVPTCLREYSWDNDNRIFITEDSFSVNGTAKDSYSFSSTDKNDVLLKYVATSHVSLNDTPVPIEYTWSTGSKASRANGNEYTVANGSVGSYTVVAKISDFDNADTLTKTFNISKTGDVAGLNATYTGKDIYVGKEYALADLRVELITSGNGSVILSSSDYTVNSQTVTSRGANTFTVYYTDSNGTSWSAPFTVNGYSAIGSISAVYTGPNVTVGERYDAANVIVTAYYADDTAKENGFVVTPSMFSSQVVGTVGSNLYTVYYIDTNNGNRQHSAQFSVTGEAQKNISSISATYTGGVVTVGNQYAKNSVSVVINYSDGTKAVATDFSVNNLVVSKVGANTFTATVMDKRGALYTDTFDVTGVAGVTAKTVISGISSITAQYVGGTVKVGADYNKNDVVVTIHYEDGTNLKTTAFTLNSTRVSVAGDNNFTATVTDSTGKAFSTNFIVPGWLLTNVASIDAVYNGPAVLIGDNYNKALVAVTIKFTDGTADRLTDDFTVSSTTVTAEGANTFTAYVVDSNGTTYSDDFLVRGTSNAAEAGKAPLSQTGVQTGDNSQLLGLYICLFGAIIFFVTLLYIRFVDMRRTEQARGNENEDK